MFNLSLAIALKSLKKNKVRTALTVFGIVIGISSVIAVMSVGEAAKQSIFKQIETFGTNIIQIEIKIPSTGKTSTENAIGIAQGIEITTLTLDDQEAINKLPNIIDSYAGLISQQLASYNEQNKQILLMGVSPSFINIDQGLVEVGRFFTEDEDKGLVNVVVLGSKVSEKIFGQDDFLGKSVKIGKQKFTVIGQMEERGATFGFDMDDMVYVPVRTLQKKIMGINHVSYITAQVENNDIADQTAEEINFLLRDRHDISDPDKDDFHATPMTEALSILDSVFWAISLLLIAVAGISLIVGGVGIMNIMYVSVLERTYEIGLRKAVGASSRHILFQFLLEAIIVTLLGAIVGMIFGVVISFVISIVANSFGMSWTFTVLPSSLILASSVAIGIGLIFGIFPARAAAKLDPITALRYNR